MLKLFCKVTNRGWTYSTFRRWVMKFFPEYLDIYTYILNEQPSEDKTYILLASGDHDSPNSDEVVALILDPEKAQIYTIGFKGIEMVN